jgi:hypothetical protein
VNNRPHKSVHLEIAKWTGTAAGVLGAILIALNIGLVVYGFGFFLLSALFWAWVGWVQRETSLVILQCAFLVIDALGFYRWIEF